MNKIELIKAEIERRLRFWDEMVNNSPEGRERNTCISRIKELKDLFSFIDSLTEEKPSEDLEKEIPKTNDSIPADCASSAKCENEHNKQGDFVFELRQIISKHRYSDIYCDYVDDEVGMAKEIYQLCKQQETCPVK